MPQDAFGGAYDQRDGLVTEGIVPEPHDVARGVEEGFHVIRIEAGKFDGVGDAAFDVLIDREDAGVDFAPGFTHNSDNDIVAHD